MILFLIVWKICEEKVRKRFPPKSSLKIFRFSPVQLLHTFHFSSSSLLTVHGPEGSPYYTAGCWINRGGSDEGCVGWCSYFGGLFFSPNYLNPYCLCTAPHPSGNPSHLIDAGAMRYNKIKVGRVSGYPVVVRTGKSEHEAILFCDDKRFTDPQNFLDFKRRSSVRGHRPRDVEIRWTVAGYDAVVPSNSVRLKPPDQGGRTTRGGGSFLTDSGQADGASGGKPVTRLNKIGEVGGVKKRKAGKADVKPAMAMSGVAIKAEEYAASTDSGEDGDNIQPPAVRSGVNIKREFAADTDDEGDLKPEAATSGATVKPEFAADTDDDEDGLKPEDIGSNAAVKSEFAADTDDDEDQKPEAVKSSVAIKSEVAAETDDEIERGDAKRQKVNSSEEPGDAVALKFFQKLNSLLEEQQGVLDGEIKEMIRKNPHLLGAKCPQDIERGHQWISKGCTATEVCCQYDSADARDLLFELVTRGAKATDKCYMDCMDDYVMAYDHFIVLLLSGYMQLQAGEYSRSSYLLDRVVDGLNYLEDNDYEPGTVTLELLRILYKTIKLGDWISCGDIESVHIDNINKLPQLQVGVTHEKDGPMDELLKHVPIEKVRERWLEWRRN